MTICVPIELSGEWFDTSGARTYTISPYQVTLGLNSARSDRAARSSERQRPRPGPNPLWPSGPTPKLIRVEAYAAAAQFEDALATADRIEDLTRRTGARRDSGRTGSPSSGCRRTW